MVRPSQRREMAKASVETKRESIHFACRLFSVSATCYRYERKLSDENARIADWLVRLTASFRSWGFGVSSQRKRLQMESQARLAYL